MKRLKENAKSNTEEPKEEACGLNTLVVHTKTSVSLEKLLLKADPFEAKSCTDKKKT